MQPDLDENGRVVYRNKDGSIAKVTPSAYVVLETLGFPVPYGENLQVHLGDPYEHDAIVVTVWVSSGGNTYLLRKGDGERVMLGPESGEAMRKGELNLSNATDYAMDRPSELVDPEEFEQREGLEVVETEEGYFINDKYRPTNKLFPSLPGGWGILEKGDAALTRAVKRAGPYWTLLRYKGKHRTEAGVCASAEVIAAESERLGGQGGRQRRVASKETGRQEREQQLTRDFEQIMREEFPGMPEEDIEETVSRARAPGRVGKAAGLYFSSKRHQEDSLRSHARLAVEAHVRHKYTDYDGRLSRGEGNEWKRMVRQEVREDVNQKLREWQDSGSEEGEAE